MVLAAFIKQEVNIKELYSILDRIGSEDINEPSENIEGSDDVESILSIDEEVRKTVWKTICQFGYQGCALVVHPFKV